LVHDPVLALRELYRRQLCDLAEQHADYVTKHSSEGSIRRQIHSFNLYKKYLAGTVLDWGCMHAPDACLIRLEFGDRAMLHGCDFYAPGDFNVFHESARLEYTQLSHFYQLPYASDFFDVVISSGVLEHVPNDFESMKEIYRVLRPGGRFIVTFLPNTLSYTERLSQLLGRKHHRRKYSKRWIEAAMLHSGFDVVEARYFQMVPTMFSMFSREVALRYAKYLAVLWPLNGIAERLWPINRLSSNLMAIGVKLQSM
jgi:SAM-dependent methyltransferase